MRFHRERPSKLEFVGIGFLIREKLADRLNSAGDSGKLLKRCLDCVRFRHPAKLHKRLNIFDQRMGSQARAFQNGFAGAYLWVAVNQREAFPEIVDLVHFHSHILSILSLSATGTKAEATMKQQAARYVPGNQPEDHLPV